MTAAGLDPALDASNLAVPSARSARNCFASLSLHSVLSRSHRVSVSVHPWFLPAMYFPLALSFPFLAVFAVVSLPSSPWLKSTLIYARSPAHPFQEWPTCTSLSGCLARFTERSGTSRGLTLLFWALGRRESDVRNLCDRKLISCLCASPSECSSPVLITSERGRNSRCDRVLDRSADPRLLAVELKVGR